MNDLKTAAQQVLDYWESVGWGDAVMVDKMDALRAALAQQVQQTPESIYHPCTFILIKSLKELKAWDVLAEWDKAREIVDKRFRAIERAHGIKG